MRSLAAIAIILPGLGLLLGCGPRGKPKPVAIVWTEDSCAECRMAVSDHKFAAELVKPDGSYLAFDDIGCLVEHVRGQGAGQGSAMYVVNFSNEEWLDAETAAFLYSKELPTPMSYGIAAFPDPAAAKEELAQWKGRVLDWPGLLKEFQP